MEEYWVSYGEPVRYHHARTTEARERNERKAALYKLRVTQFGGMPYYHCPVCGNGYVLADMAIQCHDLDRNIEGDKRVTRRPSANANPSEVETTTNGLTEAPYLTIMVAVERLGLTENGRPKQDAIDWCDKHGVKVFRAGHFTTDRCENVVLRTEFEAHLRKQYSVECYGQTDETAEFVSVRRVWELTKHRAPGVMHKHVRTWAKEHGLEVVPFGYEAKDGSRTGIDRKAFYEQYEEWKK